MALTQEELEAVKESGVCHEVPLQWSRFMDGTGQSTPVAKAKATCFVCLTEFVKTVETVNLDEV